MDCSCFLLSSFSITTGYAVYSWISQAGLKKILVLFSFLFSEQHGQSSLKRDSNQENNMDANSSVSNCTGPVIDLTGIDGQYEGTASSSIEENCTIKRRSVENAGVSDNSDVADKMFNSDFQSTSYDATDSSFKKVL